MMRDMRILDPAALLSAASSVRDGVTDLVDLPGAVSDVLDLIGRADALITRADALLSRGEDLVSRGEESLTSVESMLRDGEAMLDRSAGVLADAENAVAGASTTLMAAQELTRQAAVAIDGAGATADEAEAVLARGSALLGSAEELSARVLPNATRFVDHLEATEVDAAIGMVDRLPRLLAHLENDVLPLLGTLDRVGPDVHEILESVHEMTQALSGLPGAGFFKRRGVRKEDDEGPGAHTPAQI